MHHYAFLDMGGESEGEHLLGPPSFPPSASCLGQSHKPHLLFILNLPEGPNYSLVAAHKSPLGEPTFTLWLKLKGKGLDVSHPWKLHLLWKKEVHMKKKWDAWKLQQIKTNTHTHKQLSELKLSLLPLWEQMLSQNDLLSDELIVYDSFLSWGPHASVWQQNNPMSCGCHMKWLLFITF